MSTQTVDPRTVADALQVDTHDLTKMLCGFGSDALMAIPMWDESEYEPQSLESFDTAVEGARRHLEAAHAAWSAWNEDNPDFGKPEDE